jgi:hypothetical protein
MESSGIDIGINQTVAMIMVGVGIGVPVLCLLIGTVRLALIGFHKGN